MNTTTRTRIDKGNYVKADLTGKGDYVYGMVTLRGKTKTTFAAHDGSGMVEAHNSAVVKVTRAEFDKAVYDLVSCAVAEIKSEATPVAAAVSTPAKNTPSKPKAEEEQGEAKEATVKLEPDMSRYTAHSDIKTVTGRPSIDIADPVADLLRGHDLDRCRVLTYRALLGLGCQTFSKRKIQLSTQNLEAQYRHLNVGMQRMNLGNLIRAAMSFAGVTKLDVARLAEDVPGGKMSQTMKIK